MIAGYSFVCYLGNQKVNTQRHVGKTFGSVPSQPNSQDIDSTVMDLAAQCLVVNRHLSMLLVTSISCPCDKTLPLKLAFCIHKFVSLDNLKIYGTASSLRGENYPENETQYQNGILSQWVTLYNV